MAQDRRRWRRKWVTAGGEIERMAQDRRCWRRKWVTAGGEIERMAQDRRCCRAVVGGLCPGRV